MQVPRPENFDGSSLKNLLITGGRMPQSTFLEMKKVLAETKVLTCYGQTEAGSITGFNVFNEEDQALARAKPQSCGRPINGIWCKVVDYETEKTLGFNEPGEIRVKSEAIMNGYYKMDSSSAWDSEGWLKTGDLGYYDEDFCFFIIDRIKDIMHYEGYHVPPAVIEKVLLTHPAVKEVLVFGTPHEIYEDLPTALVVLKENAGHVDSEELRNYADERLDNFKKLRGGLKIVEHLYYTHTKKYRRHYTKQMYLSGKI